VVVYASGSERYCARVLDYIEQSKRYFAHRAYGDHLLCEGIEYSVKHYEFLFSDQRTCDNTIIVDLSPAIYCMKVCNGVPIERFLANVSIPDHALIPLAKYLEELNFELSICQTVGRTVRAALLNSTKSVPKKAVLC
jgi:TFIIF-interacting CTD phosphatase-like protein